MKLLILTQKVDVSDSVLGFFHDWIIEFSKHYEQVTVICLQMGVFDLPKNVRVFSLGKESRQSRVLYVFNFFRYVCREHKQYDQVFVHMNHEYVVLGGLLWKLLGKKVSLWYTHRQTSATLRIAEKLVDFIFSSSKESFLVPTKKLHTMGHGINPKNFICAGTPVDQGVYSIVSVGRITEIKNCDILIKAAEILKKTWDQPFKVTFVGSPVNAKDQVYLDTLKSMVIGAGLQNEIYFVGSVPNTAIAKFYCSSHLSVNLCPTGGMDKAVLESLFSKTPVLVTNKVFAPILGRFERDFFVNERNEYDLAEKIKAFFNRADRSQVAEELNDIVSRQYTLDRLISKIVAVLNPVRV
jgi:glycosyltransferase involved in cell wall biosynthesis